MGYRERQAMYVYRNNEARPHNHCRRGKAVLHILGSLSYPASTAHAPYAVGGSLYSSTTFFTLSHKRHDFRKKLFSIKFVF
jgi:hypothetical protein